MRELPVATKMAGVNMRLNPAGSASCTGTRRPSGRYMLAGRCPHHRRRRPRAQLHRRRRRRATSGTSRPASRTRSRGWRRECEFLLVFDDGNFSENETFLITDWFAHTPREVLAKNFGVPEAAFANLPTNVEQNSLHLPGAKCPARWPRTQSCRPRAPCLRASATGCSAQEPIKVAGGQVRIVDSTKFPAATTIAAALVEVEPGGLRELHWHPNTDEWQYYISRPGPHDGVRLRRQGAHLRLPGGRRRLRPVRMGHYVENTGDETLRFLEMFRSDRLRRRVAQPVDGADAARAGAAAPEPGPADASRSAQGQAGHR